MGVGIIAIVCPCLHRSGRVQAALYQNMKMQIFMRLQVIDVIFGALHAMGNTKAEMAKAFLDGAVALLVAGRVLEVLAAVERWTKVADPSFVRYFVFKVLAISSAPYSPDFAAALLRWMKQLLLSFF